MPEDGGGGGTEEDVSIVAVVAPAGGAEEEDALASKVSMAFWTLPAILLLHSLARIIVDTV